MHLLEFANWFQQNSYPHDFSLMDRVVVTDVSTSVLVYSKDSFLVELYFMHPDVEVVPHSHPFENCIIFVNGDMTSKREGMPADTQAMLSSANTGDIGGVLKSGLWHAFKTGKNGCVFYNLTKWENIDDKDSAIFAYNGKPLGPLHKQLLESYKSKH